MTRDEIMTLAREAGFTIEGPHICTEDRDGVIGEELDRFAALVAAAEREACAKVCDMLPMYGPDDETADWYGYALSDCAKAIRARGQA